MASRMESGRRRTGRAVCLLMSALLGAACGEGDEGVPAAAESVSAVPASPEVQADTGQEARRRFLPDEMRRATRAETFSHPAHGEIDCAVCHQVPRGHGSHGDVGCAECHRASATATVRALSPADCQACHHDPRRALSCDRCHASEEIEQSVQQLTLEVWSGPRPRTLTFDHGRHAELACAQCHREAPELQPESCASCHESHHVATARCQSCHTQPPPGAHGVDAHLTCSGSGCHRARDVEAMSDTRAVCLVCHQAQETHEPDGQCVQCHAVRPVGRVGRGP